MFLRLSASAGDCWDERSDGFGRRISLVKSDASALLVALRFVHVLGHTTRESVRRPFGVFERLGATFSCVSSMRASSDRLRRRIDGATEASASCRVVEWSVSLLAGDTARGEQLQRIVDGLLTFVASGRLRLEPWPLRGTNAAIWACLDDRERQTHFGADGCCAGAVEALCELAGVGASGSGCTGQVLQERGFGCVIGGQGCRNECGRSLISVSVGKPRRGTRACSGYSPRSRPTGR